MSSEPDIPTIGAITDAERVEELQAELKQIQATFGDFQHESQGLVMQLERELGAKRHACDESSRALLHCKAEISQWKARYEEKDAEIVYLQEQLELALAEKADLKRRTSESESRVLELEQANSLMGSAVKAGQDEHNIAAELPAAKMGHLQSTAENTTTPISRVRTIKDRLNVHV